jgi:hypothetical protein
LIGTVIVPTNRAGAGELAGSTQHGLHRDGWPLVFIGSDVERREWL